MSMPAVSQKPKCLPTYIVVDTSGSMTQHQDLLNAAVENIFDKVGGSPRVAEFAHIAIISFNTEPHLVLEMTDIELATAIPELACQGVTNYGATFTLLRNCIDTDIQRLRDAGRSVLRPAVFFLTDGAPSDTDWAGSYTALVDPAWTRRPHIIAFGFGLADQKVVGQVATKAAFQANSLTEDHEAIASVINSLLNSLVASAEANALLLPHEIEGFTAVPMEEVY